MVDITNLLFVEVKKMSRIKEVSDIDRGQDRAQDPNPVLDPGLPVPVRLIQRKFYIICFIDLLLALEAAAILDLHNGIAEIDQLLRVKT